MSIKRDSIWAAQPSTTRGVAVHLSYDAKSDRVAYAAIDSVHLRSVANATEASQFTGHVHATSVAKFAPSGFYIASGDAAGNVKVWDAAGEDMVVKGEYPVIQGRINDVAWDADSQRIIAVGAGKERYGHCFTYDSGNTVGAVSGHSDVVNAVSIRPVRPYRAATVADDASLVFYQGPPFRFQFSSQGNHTNFVNDVQFSPNGEHIVSVSADRKIVLYDGKTGEFVQAIEGGHAGSIFAVSWSKDSTKFVTASADRTVKLWDVASKEATTTWTFPAGLDHHQVGVVFTGDSSVVSLSYSGDLSYLEPSSETPVKVVTGHQKSISTLAHDGKSLISGSVDGKIVRWESGPGASTSLAGHEGLVVGVVFDGTKLWSVGWDDTLKAVGDEGAGHKLPSQPKAVAANSNGKVVIVFEEEIHVYENGVSVASTKLDSIGPLQAVDISDKRIAVGSSTNNIRVFNLGLSPSGEQLGPLRSGVSYLAFSPNGELLAAGETTGKITLFDVAEQKMVTGRWAFHTSRVTSISWHPSGEYVVSGSSDTNAIVYSVASPSKNIKVLGAHKSGTNAVLWTGDKTFVSAGNDATVKHWTVSFE